MIRPLLCLALLVGGSLLVVQGIRTAQERSCVADVATRFLEAVGRGDALAAHALLETTTSANRAASLELTPSPETEFDLVSVELDGDDAIVKARIERHGYVLRPRLKMHRRPNGDWRVTAIENAEVDPLWVDRFEETLDPRDRPLADIVRPTRHATPGRGKNNSR